jgi:glucose-1-phosphate cytidylyltransferase
MKAVILAGGFGTRLSEETTLRPKPMVEIGGRPILWHIMKSYAAHGVTEFVICLGYKGYMIKEFFANFFLHSCDVEIDLKNNSIKVLNNEAEPWKVTLVDTGDNTMTGGRVKRIRPFVEGTFLLTYGDGLCDVDIAATIRFHKEHGKKATVTTVRPSARFGGIQFDGDRVVEFTEKPQKGEGWINGGYFVMEPSVFDYIEGDTTILERDPLEGLVRDNELMAYRHEGFWQCMDTVREKELLEELWANDPKWKVW